MDKATEKHLHNHLIKLGDMMGDGLHLEPDGKWISKEYTRAAKALGLIKPKPRRTAAINERMAQRVKDVACPKCAAKLQQTRSGSKRAKCTQCNTKYQLLK